jgi:hypothetical protein
MDVGRHDPDRGITSSPTEQKKYDERIAAPWGQGTADWCGLKPSRAWIEGPRWMAIKASLENVRLWRHRPLRLKSASSRIPPFTGPISEGSSGSTVIEGSSSQEHRLWRPNVPIVECSGNFRFGSRAVARRPFADRLKRPDSPRTVGCLGKDWSQRYSRHSVASAKGASPPEGEVPGFNNVGSLPTQSAHSDS